MLDRAYRTLLRLLRRRYDIADRDEMWGTYVERVAAARTTGGALGAFAERVRELSDLIRAGLGTPGLSRIFDSLARDLRVGVRSLSRSPLTSMLAVASLALGIGATTTIFSALDVWLIRPLPVPNAERLVSVAMANRERGWGFNALSVPDYTDWQQASQSVDLAAYRFSSFNLSTGDRIERADAIEVSVNLLDVLGVVPHRGRAFSQDEGTAAGPRVTMLAYAFWESSFAADPSIVGQSIRLDGVPHTVIGLLPAGHDIPGIGGDVWVPVRISGEERRDQHGLNGVGLLQPEATLSVARDELGTIAAQVALQDPDVTFPEATVIPLRERVYGRQFQQGGMLLSGSVLFVLLIACANIANLLLARGMARTQELAIRGALGAGRGRIVRQLLTESLVIAVIGGVMGLAVAYLGIDLLLTQVLPGEQVPGMTDIGLNGRGLVVTSVLTVGSTLLFGLLPALRTSSVDVRDRLSAGGGATVGSSRSKLGSALVIGEISASLVLLILTGLMIRQLTALHQLDMGMRTDEALVFRVSLPQESYATMGEAHVFCDELTDRLTAVPGIRSVASSSGHPLRMWSTTLYSIPALEGDGEAARRSAESRRVSSEYLALMELGLEAGRWFDRDIDVPEAPRVAVVSRAMADLWWESPDDALGEVVRFNGTSREIVGVVAGGRLRGPQDAPPPIIFEPIAQRPARYVFHVVDHGSERQAVASQIRETIREMDPNLAVFNIQSLEDAFAETVSGLRAGLRILAVLGAIAMLLTVVGVYGVMAHTVNLRKREMGLRMALGASAGGVTRLVLTRSGRIAAIGLGVGLTLSLIAGQAVQFLLVGVSPRDPIILVGVSALLFATVTLASYLPARRAGRVDPVRTLAGD